MDLAGIERRTFELLEPSASDDWQSKACDLLIVAVVIANIVAVILESVPSLHEAHAPVFAQIEFWSVMFFTVEYVLRFWVTGIRYPIDQGGPWRGRREYAGSFYGIVDLLAILPFYLQTLFPQADLRVLRVLRLLRILKLSHYNTALEDLFSAIRNERKSFIAALYLLAIAVILTSCLMYYVEHDAQPDKFASIPDAMYWSIITLTTVGYGDVVPVTWVGQIIAPLTGLMGVCTVAMLTGIVASAFSNQMARRKVIFETQMREAFSDGVVSDDEALTLERLKKEFNLSDEQVAAITQQVKADLGR
jgi:voltage-gated potassium channel